MKKLKLIIPVSLLLFGLLISCKTVENAEAIEAEAEIPTPKAQNDSINKSTTMQVKAGDSLFAFINRSSCFGQCPTYKMSIYDDGTVFLEGIRFVRLIGDFEAKLSTKQMRMFSDMAVSIDFFEMNDVYDRPITDVPSTTLSIVIDGFRKEVYARSGYPQRIKKLSEMFDNLIENDIWTEVEER